MAPNPPNPRRSGTAADLQQQMAAKAQAQAQQAALANAPAKAQNPIMALLTRHKDQINMALPRTGLTMDRFIRIAVTTWNTNPDLAACEPKSFLAAVMLSAQMGLEPGGPMGQAWLVPYKGKVQFQVGYKGLLTMMWRSEQYQTLTVSEVCENDEFSFEYGSNQHLKHKPTLSSRGKTIGYYTYAKYKSGGDYFRFFSIDDIEKYRKFSQAPNSPAWRDHYDAMARKTALRHAATYMPMTIEAEREIAQDNAIKMDLAEDMTEVPTENVIDGTGTVVDEPGEVPFDADKALAEAEAERAGGPLDIGGGGSK